MDDGTEEINHEQEQEDITIDEVTNTINMLKSSWTWQNNIRNDNKSEKKWCGSTNLIIQ